jgi:hypothetical protein
MTRASDRSAAPTLSAEAASREPDVGRRDATLGMQQPLEHGRVGLGEERGGQPRQPAPDRLGGWDVAGSPGRRQRHELRSSDVRGPTIPPVAPSASIGELNRSSPASTAKWSGTSVIRSKGVRVEPAHGVPNAGDAGQRPEPAQRLRGERLRGPVGHVVDDQRHRAARCELREVGDHAGLARPGERRYDAQRGGDVGPVAQGVDGAQARRPDDQVRRPLPADPSDDADDRVAFVVGQAAWFARRAEGDQT